MNVLYIPVWSEEVDKTQCGEWVYDQRLHIPLVAKEFSSFQFLGSLIVFLGSRLEFLGKFSWGFSSRDCKREVLGFEEALLGVFLLILWLIPIGYPHFSFGWKYPHIYYHFHFSTSRYFCITSHHQKVVHFVLPLPLPSAATSSSSCSCCLLWPRLDFSFDWSFNLSRRISFTKPWSENV